MVSLFLDCTGSMVPMFFDGTGSMVSIFLDLHEVSCQYFWMAQFHNDDNDAATRCRYFWISVQYGVDIFEMHKANMIFLDCTRSMVSMFFDGAGSMVSIFLDLHKVL